MATRKKAFEGDKEVKRIARKRVGTVPPSRPIVPKSDRTKPKYKTPPEDEA